MIFTSAFVCLALFAVAQGAAVGQIKDVALEFEGQEFHLSPIEKRQVTNNTAQPDEVNSKIKISNDNNNNQQCQTISLPASLQLRVCGCSNPGCPDCPCKKYSNAEGADDWEDNENDRNKNTKKNNNNNNKNTNNPWGK